MVDEVGRGGGVMDLREPSLGSRKVQLTDRSLTCSSDWYSLHLGSGTCLGVILTCCSDHDLENHENRPALLTTVNSHKGALSHRL